MLTIDEIKNILFFLNSSSISGNQAITLAILQTKLSDMLSVMENPPAPTPKHKDVAVEEPKVEEEVKNKKAK